MDGNEATTSRDAVSGQRLLGPGKDVVSSCQLASSTHCPRKVMIMRTQPGWLSDIPTAYGYIE